MQLERTASRIVSVAVVACLSASLLAAPVTYQGTATIDTDTSGFPLSQWDLGFADGTNLQGATVAFSMMFDDGSFDADSEPADPEVGRYAYNGASSFTYQITGGDLVDGNTLEELGISDGLLDAWGAVSTMDAPTRGAIFLATGPTVFDDDSLRTVIDPADFIPGLANDFRILVESGGFVLATINAEINELRVTTDGDQTIIPLPAAAGAGLALLGVLSAKRTRPRRRS